ncbi:unnamed protein product [Ranitomeya imitator]|uniref:Uncharacterized protein n=1 Tax=Ranitomeya imitator TaxID=111125 RepID=A0ABN9KUY6_9NEOB|nr:unnamed protein product [Ranitomeya imitator]
MDGSNLSIQKREWKDKNRTATKAAGLYKRHSLNHPMLKGFHSYLTVTHGVPNCQQEVSNVARFLFFVNPKSVTLEYLVKPNQVNNFFQQLGKLHLSSQTSLKMLKHIRRFTMYQMRATKLRLENPQLYKACEVFMNFTTDLQKSLYKGACRESVSKRYDLLMKPSKSPKDCQIILEEARPTFLASIEAVTDGGSEVDRREVVLYLEALLILKHLQRPGVVRNMTVSEWNERIHHTYQGRRKTIVVVQCVCGICQTGLYLWPKDYHKLFRDVYREGHKKSIHETQTIPFKLQPPKHHQPPCTADLRDMDFVTIHRLRKALVFARYLAHTNDVAERVYREKTLTDMCRAQELVFNAGNHEDAKIMSPVMASTSELDNEVVDLTESDTESSDSTEEYSLKNIRLIPIRRTKPLKLPKIFQVSRTLPEKLPGFWKCPRYTSSGFPLPGSLTHAKQFEDGTAASSPYGTGVDQTPVRPVVVSVPRRGSRFSPAPGTAASRPYGPGVGQTPDVRLWSPCPEGVPTSSRLHQARQPDRTVQGWIRSDPYVRLWSPCPEGVPASRLHQERQPADRTVQGWVRPPYVRLWSPCPEGVLASRLRQAQQPADRTVQGWVRPPYVRL